MSVALYTRISQDKTGERAGVERQAKECRELADRRGLTITHEYSDNDVSAYSGKRRDGFDALLRAVSTGEVDRVLVWHPDRLYRRSADLEKLINLVEQHNIKIVTVTAGDFDLNTATGRAVARTLVAWSGFEVEQKTDRQKSAYRQRAERGGWPFAHRPFGYQRVNGEIVQVPDEAAVLRDILSRYYEKLEPRHAIMRDLNQRGILTPRRKPWGIIQLRDVLTNDRYGGVVKHGDTVLDVKPSWEPIVDRDVWLGWRSRAAKRKRKSTFSSAKYLLTGIARCDVCGAVCFVKHRADGGRSYFCSDLGCVQRSVPAVDDLVERLVIGRLSMPDASQVFAPRNEDTADISREIEAKQARLDDMAALVADGTLSADAVRAEAKPLREQMERLRAVLAERQARATIPAELFQQHAGEAWDSLPLIRKRAVVSAIMRVSIGRQANPRIFDPEAVRIEWVSDAK
ncbi:recombinase family protein [Microbacterium awajiense]|uniref:Recombinase family protein n=1 Tax=Microbacterium awajiense TaxID=415214 RepID=A0ABP7A731_9MICO